MTINMLLPNAQTAAHRSLYIGERISWWATFARNLVIRHGVMQLLKAAKTRAIVMLARLSGQPLIHVIGDSHVQVFKGMSKYVLIHRLGPSTAYNLGRKASTTNSNSQLFRIVENSSRRDIVVLVFGEIDCRIHIYNQYEKNKRQFTIGMRLAVYSVPPVGTAGNAYGYPHYATRETRGTITREFNQKLKLLCRQKGYKFLDIYSAVCDERGFMPDQYAFDDTHLNGKVAGLIVDRFSDEFGIHLDRIPWTFGWAGMLREALSKSFKRVDGITAPKAPRESS
jgi:lysophospholipase L1-like esterase